jgi:hypothetical protein
LQQQTSQQGLLGWQHLWVQHQQCPLGHSPRSQQLANQL